MDAFDAHIRLNRIRPPPPPGQVAQKPQLPTPPPAPVRVRPTPPPPPGQVAQKPQLPTPPPAPVRVGPPPPPPSRAQLPAQPSAPVPVRVGPPPPPPSRAQLPTPIPAQPPAPVPVRPTPPPPPSRAQPSAQPLAQLPPVAPKPYTFFIYTTGFADGGTNSVVYHWNTFLRKNICKSIPERYKRIEILHSDPTINSETIDLLRQENSERIKSTVTRDIIDFTKIDEKHRGQNYLVIDSAHLFNYHEGSLVNNSEAYNDATSLKSFGNARNNKFVLHALYPGFFGYRTDSDKNDLGILRTNFGKYELFNVSEDGTVTTYIDILLRQKIQFHGNPTLFIEGIYNRIKSEFIKIWRIKYSNLSGYDDRMQQLNTIIFDKIFSEIIENIKTEIEVKAIIIAFFKENI